MTGSRRFRDWLFGCYAWGVFILVVLSFGIVLMVLRRPSWGRPVARCATRLMFRLAGMPLSARGIERLPSAPHLLLVNHTSFLDGLVLVALLPPRPGYAFVVRQQYRSQSLICPLLRGIGVIVLMHSRPGRKGSNVKRLTRALKDGENVILFPEGMFVPEPGLRPFHSGAFLAAAGAKVPVVVAGLRGVRKALQPGTWMPRRGALHLEIGPVTMPGDGDVAAAEELREAVRRAMAPLSGEGLAEGGFPVRQHHLP
ncbi:MAG TPA: lysophospholipid acyltransferase family protein [Noviherbaspirillum sp.]|uniref:lysophospholipid acyltransferase family protein n=1 Tax=Noviherbaspirillum sp. TaxID=1926288 RepID=UPI002B459610|nr:lysophospholipid acyltransferase family protein [Noviherbaspirillum sp.]HJV88576.1 lysophospholipid acyltransferase family protein [Noviherbaspirillum sp.]